MPILQLLEQWLDFILGCRMFINHDIQMISHYQLLGGRIRVKSNAWRVASYELRSLEARAEGYYFLTGFTGFAGLTGMWF